MTPLTPIVRDLVGRRSRITRDEMIAILLECGRRLPIDLPSVSTIACRYDTGDWNLGPRHPYVTVPPDQAAYRTAARWAELCNGITCISVSAPQPDGYPGCIRYDEPGSLHPMQRADLTFVPADIDASRLDGGSSVRYMRQHADRVLLVGP